MLSDRRVDTLSGKVSYKEGPKSLHQTWLLGGEALVNVLRVSYQIWGEASDVVWEIC